eukprot:CAMPEP_0176479116 /NCGR_PEP_ID=MMETSP0200_2-20121128/1565_1 /TAXON_ID=947934 /ORGANISM="Chaetoceros sp., Strain GSL56" /LENGTH=306 /DNA_ID=CAMNT_0017875133 /DNA_START=11 /DNA_END=931 /DNA_ORIENTATION=+
MSRHRNIRNMCEDDYYDYDEDDYYDDEYWEGEEEEQYNSYNQGQQEHLRKEPQASNKPNPPVSIKPTAPAISSASKKQVTISMPSSSSYGISDKERIEKERLVISMGFTADKAKASLENHGWDVEQAIHELLLNSETPTNKGMTMAPPQALMPPPPGLGDNGKVSDTKGEKATKKEKKISISSSSMKGSSQDAKIATKIGVEFAKSSKKVSDNASISTSSKVSATQRKAKKISPEMQKKLESQKSRLSMVILGHVDAGKSTLMGQVLVQMGMVQKRLPIQQSQHLSLANVIMRFVIRKCKRHRPLE